MQLRGSSSARGNGVLRGSRKRESGVQWRAMEAMAKGQCKGLLWYALVTKVTKKAMGIANTAFAAHPAIIGRPCIASFITPVDISSSCAVRCSRLIGDFFRTCRLHSALGQGGSVAPETGTMQV